jgi:AcrR family transcriptional regulator
MPYPAQTDRTSIIDCARELIEAEGVADLSLSKLAAALGVKAPSLYHYVANKTALLRAVNQVTMHELTGAMWQADDPSLPLRDRLVAMVHGYRRYALAHPATYALAFTTIINDLEPDPEENEQLALPIQGLVAQLVGEAGSLAALRGAWAMVHGFVMLEISGSFQRGGSVDDAFSLSTRAYFSGLGQ